MDLGYSWSYSWLKGTCQGWGADGLPSQFEFCIPSAGFRTRYKMLNPTRMGLFVTKFQISQQAVLKDEYDASKGEDKTKLLEDFQSNELLNTKVNITEWLASLSTQVVKLNKLSHWIDDDYLMTHVLANQPEEYNTLVDHAKIDWRSKTLKLIELKKRLEEKSMQLRKENGWDEHKMVFSASHNSIRNQNKVSNQRKTTKSIGRCCHCGKFGHKNTDCRNWLKLTKEE